jgi:hypothetical protein
LSNRPFPFLAFFAMAAAPRYGLAGYWGSGLGRGGGGGRCAGGGGRRLRAAGFLRPRFVLFRKPRLPSSRATSVGRPENDASGKGSRWFLQNAAHSLLDRTKRFCAKKRKCESHARAKSLVPARRAMAQAGVRDPCTAHL